MARTAWKFQYRRAQCGYDAAGLFTVGGAQGGRSQSQARFAGRGALYHPRICAADGSRSVSAKYDWWDAAIGIRYMAPLAAKWDFVGYADVGGGGSDLTYELLAGVNWRFSQHLSAKAGYRYFYQDYSKDDFKWDMAMSGVYLGLGIRF